MRHVLVIEDQFLLAQCYRDLAIYAGASSVEIVADEEAAIKAARHHPPTVIVSDVDLEKGGRGPDAVARIHALCGTVPAIFVTGNPEDPAARTLKTVAAGRWEAGQNTRRLGRSEARAG